MAVSGTTRQRVGRREAATPAEPALDEGAREIQRHFAELPPRPDWSGLMEAGTVPALILGAERRLRR
jgi:hypothetical protein